MTQLGRASAATPSEPSHFGSIIALLVSVMLLTAGTNLQGVLLPVHRHLEGASVRQIGLLSSSWSFGFVVACLVLGRLISAVGHVRSFAGLAAISGSMALLLLPLDDAVAWIILRMIIGFCFGGLSIIIESWLNERSGTRHRGSIFAAYMTVSLVASLSGTFSLAFLDPMQGLPYTLMVLAVVLSIVPITLARSPAPKPIEPFSIKLLSLYRLSPSGAFGCFTAGLVSSALGGLLPTYGLSIGFSNGGVACLLGAAVLGGAIAYYPAGVLSDRMDRRIVVIALASLSFALCVLLVLRPNLAPRSVTLLVGGLGFAQYPLYGICVAMSNDRVREQSFAEIASGLLIIYGTGNIVGPLMAATLMQRAPRYLFLFMSIVLAVMVGFIVMRVQRRARPLMDLRRRIHPLESAPNTVRLFRPRE